MYKENKQTMMSSSSSIFCFLLLISLHLYSAGASDCIALRQFVDSFTITEEASQNLCYSAYPKTTSWNNVTDCCTWDGVTCGNVSVGSGEVAVIGIDLSCSWLQGDFDSNSSLFSLRSLRRLNLAGNYFDYSKIPSTFRVFLDMTHLNLAGSSLVGYIPREFAHLSKLESLELSSSDYRFPLAFEDNVLKLIMQNLTRLTWLSLDQTYFSPTSTPFRNLSSPSLNYLSLRDCGLKGFMVSELFRLPKLEYLNLSGNVDFRTLSSSDNWTSPLLALDLSGTRSIVRLLEKIVTLKTLNYLNLHGDPILGEIPASFGNLTALEYLDLSATGISGSLPSTFAKLEQLSYLNLQESTDMSGVVDFEIFANMRKMRTLVFPPNRLDILLQDGGNGSFPELEELNLRACSLTKFPYFLSSSKGLKYLDLSENMITGPIPRWLWSLGNDTLEKLILSDNLITGVLSPFAWKKLSSVQIQNNLLQGELFLPPSATMKGYYAYNNNFTGIIPSSICQLSQLMSLFLSDNKLSGTIPGCISNLTVLDSLDVSSNHLDGRLPRSLSNCTLLFIFNVSHNRIKDTFPDWFQPNSLRSLDLQSNNFHGPVRIADSFPFVEIIIYNLANNAFTGRWPADYFLNSSYAFYILDLSKNNFVGPIPVPPPDVQYYDVSDNNFTCEIPTLICDATGLKVINLSNNSLVGGIPRCLAKLRVSLSVLNLRNNKLIGKIPQIFGRGNRLRTVDFSRNNLSGTVPRSLAKMNGLNGKRCRSGISSVSYSVLV